MFIESLNDAEAYLNELVFFSSVDDAAAWENIAKQLFNLLKYHLKLIVLTKAYNVPILKYAAVITLLKAD